MKPVPGAVLLTVTVLAIQINSTSGQNQGPGEAYTTFAQRRGPGLRGARKGHGADQSGGVQSIWGVQFMHIISLCMFNQVLIIILMFQLNCIKSTIICNTAVSARGKFAWKVRR